jgi:hypothetical protein
VPAPRKRRTDILILLALIVIGIAGILAYIITHNSGRCYTMGDVWKYASSLDGKRICVKGKAVMEVIQSMVLCDPPNCDCNESSGNLTLVSEEGIIRNPRIAIVDTITIYSPICTDNECTITCTCTPINSFAADYLQFADRLSNRYLSDGRMAYLELKEVDLSASCQLVNRDWQPIPTVILHAPLTKFL